MEDKIEYILASFLTAVIFAFIGFWLGHILEGYLLQKDICHTITNDLGFYEKCLHSPRDKFIQLIKELTNEKQ